jgi:hypothetical protein
MDWSTNEGPPGYGPWKDREVDSPERRAAGKKAFEWIMNTYIPDITSKLNAGESVDVWAIVFKRLAQNSDPMRRKRIVIGPWKGWAIIGKTMSWPLLQHLKGVYLNGVRIFAALTNPYEIALDMQQALENASADGNIVVSGDLANYDATIPPEMIIHAADVIARCLTNDTAMRAMGESLAYRYNVITPTKVYLGGPSSMKSGDPWTNLIDSIVLLIALAFGQLKYGYTIKNVSVQGDDFIISGDGIDPSAIEQVFADFGLDANASKQLYEKDALSFLQLLHFKGVWGGIASVYRIFGRSLSYERFKRKPKNYTGYADVVAVLGRLENAWNSPWYEDTIELFREDDKFDLGANLSPEELLAKSGDAGLENLQVDSVSWKTGHKVNGFARMTVNEVLRGGSLPPQGSRERFLRAYEHLVA